jgi:hypothetical protein
MSSHAMTKPPFGIMFLISESEFKCFKIPLGSY